MARLAGSLCVLSIRTPVVYPTGTAAREAAGKPPCVDRSVGCLLLRLVALALLVISDVFER